MIEGSDYYDLTYHMHKPTRPSHMPWRLKQHLDTREIQSGKSGMMTGRQIEAGNNAINSSALQSKLA